LANDISIARFLPCLLQGLKLPDISARYGNESSKAFEKYKKKGINMQEYVKILT
jgi:hypothetical protein